MDDQDWELVTIRSKKARVSDHKITSPTKHSNTGSELRKVETAESGKPKMLTVKSRSDMASGRMEKLLTQKQLDMMCKFPANTTSAFEAGRLCPTSIQVQSINRVLGIKLERV